MSIKRSSLNIFVDAIVGAMIRDGNAIVSYGPSFLSDDGETLRVNVRARRMSDSRFVVASLALGSAVESRPVPTEWR